MTRQVGIDNTSADYFAFLDSDDVLMPYAVEVWRNAAENIPDADLFHSSFMEQTVHDGRTSMMKHDHAVTFCHGKLYKTSFVRKFDIRNSPEVKWADDSFFNVMCMELGNCGEIKIPMYLWLNNPNSVTRAGGKPFFADFVHAMLLATRFVKTKGIKELDFTILGLTEIQRNFARIDEASLKEYEELLKEFPPNIAEQYTYNSPHH